MNEKYVVDLQRKVETSETQYQYCIDLINTLQKQINELKNCNFVSKKESDENTNHLKCNINELQKSIKYISDKYTSSSDSLEAIKSGLNNCVLSCREISKNTSSLEQEFNLASKDIYYKINHNENLISKTFSSIKSEIEEKFSLIKKEVASYPKSILENNEKIMTKVEIAQMDAQNVALKYSNLETQLKIFDRKLENLDIRIKKMELLDKK